MHRTVPFCTTQIYESSILAMHFEVVKLSTIGSEINQLHHITLWYSNFLFLEQKLRGVEATVLCISLEMLIVTYLLRYNFRHALADV